MSLSPQEVVERAGVELSRCISGLGLRARRDREENRLKEDQRAKNDSRGKEELSSSKRSKDVPGGGGGGGGAFGEKEGLLGALGAGSNQHSPPPKVLIPTRTPEGEAGGGGAGGGGGGGVGSGPGGGRMGSVRRGGGVMEKVANVFCGSSLSGGGGGSGGGAKNNKPVPPEKPSRFLLGKGRNGAFSQQSASQAVPTPPMNGHPGGLLSGRGTPPAILPSALGSHSNVPQTRVGVARASPAHYLRVKHRYLSWDELVRDEGFLTRFFMYFSPLERAVLAQVCTRWRSVLYQPRFWHGLRPVLNCKQVRHASSVEKTTDMRRRFYISVQKRGFDSLVLLCANDEDLLDLVSNYAVNHTGALRSLALRCSNVSDKGLETLLDHLSGVYQLELQGCNEVTEAGLWACLNPRIVSLSVFDCINVADEAVGAMAQLLPSLYELNLQAYHVTDAALAFFSPRQTTTLSILRLQSCWELTNHAIVNIVHSLPNLTVLSLSGCSKVTDDGVELIAENLRQLRSLDLSWCPRITDAALEYIACDLTQLEELTLDRCVHITDIGVGYISTMLSLTALFLRWCSQVRDFGVQHLCSMRNLQVLSLAGCTLVTSVGLSSLVQLRHLQELELTNCPGASPELHQHLHLHLPRCLVIE
ncbi:uncharacterized protein LOC143026581 [Oratosquilla oratoria]|uniref:uncharacterized protein LOC143026581 n=1 Tax=Oratosquilla oratoria TaxID=337810 RepID=UPI003F76BD35